MTIRDLDVDMPQLRITDFENFFNVHQDKDGNYFFNLNTTMYVNAAPEVQLTHVCNCKMHWPLVSYKLYGTTRLAWMLMKLNNVKPADVFKPLMPGDTVKYIDKTQMNSLVADMNGF